MVMWSIEADRGNGGLEFAVYQGRTRRATHDFVEDAVRYVRKRIGAGERVTLIESDGSISDITRKCTSGRRGW